MLPDGMEWRPTLSLSSPSWRVSVFTRDMVSPSCAWRSFISFCSGSASSVLRDMQRNRGNHSRLAGLTCVCVWNGVQLTLLCNDVSLLTSTTNSEKKVGKTREG